MLLFYYLKVTSCGQRATGNGQRATRRELVLKPETFNILFQRSVS